MFAAGPPVEAAHGFAALDGALPPHDQARGRGGGGGGSASHHAGRAAPGERRHRWAPTSARITTVDFCTTVDFWNRGQKTNGGKGLRTFALSCGAACARVARELRESCARCCCARCCWLCCVAPRSQGRTTERRRTIRPQTYDDLACLALRCTAYGTPALTRLMFPKQRTLP